MEWLNYHHLLYFWTVARRGSVSRAAEELRLAQPTISGQLRLLEEHFGEKLFAREGRRLVLTEIGQVVFRYADEIFSIGRELTDVLRGRPRGRPVRLHVGVTDVIPKLVAHRILAPVLQLPEPVRLLCIEGDPATLARALSSHGLDLLIADAPFPPALRVRAYNHLLGSCRLSVFGSPAVASKYRRGFPRSLDGAPVLLQTEASVTRRPLEQWFESIDVRPQIVGEFQDSALIGTFGAQGTGLFFAPSAIEREVAAHYRVKLVGRIDSVIERFYAISVERRLKHPAVVALTQAARTTLFSETVNG